MWAAQHFVVTEPIGVDGPEQSERDHSILAVEDVVDEALEIVRIVRVGHDVRRVGRGEPERMGKLVRLFRKGSDLLEARLIAELLKVRVVGRDARSVEEFHHSAVGQRVKVTAQEELRVRRIRLVVARPE